MLSRSRVFTSSRLHDYATMAIEAKANQHQISSTHLSFPLSKKWVRNQTYLLWQVLFFHFKKPWRLLKATAVLMLTALGKGSYIRPKLRKCLDGNILHTFYPQIQHTLNYIHLQLIYHWVLRMIIDGASCPTAEYRDPPNWAVCKL